MLLRIKPLLPPVAQRYGAAQHGVNRNGVIPPPDVTDLHVADTLRAGRPAAPRATPTARAPRGVDGPEARESAHDGCHSFAVRFAHFRARPTLSMSLRWTLPAVRC
jgi:hypothetical protein